MNRGSFGQTKKAMAETPSMSRNEITGQLQQYFPRASSGRLGIATEYNSRKSILKRSNYDSAPTLTTNMPNTGTYCPSAHSKITRGGESPARRSTFCAID